MNRNAQNGKRSLISGLNPSDHDLLQPLVGIAATKMPNCTPVNEIQEIECKNSIQKIQKTAKVIEAFHDNITCASEYVCTCCDQVCYRSSDRKCEENKYPKCSKKLFKACITTTSCIDNTNGFALLATQT